MVTVLPSELPSGTQTSRFKAQEGETLAVYKAWTEDQQPTFEFRSDDLVAGDEFVPSPVELQETFDWADPKLNREYTRLEQKALAKKATNEELTRYYQMKGNRDSEIFSERYFSDYAEIQRLKILSQKIEEIQRLMVPIKT